MHYKLYIDLLKKVLIDYHRLDFVEYRPLEPNFFTKSILMIARLIKTKNYAICYETKYKIEDRLEGRDWPTYADTMIGLKRLENIEFCFMEIIRNNIPGDFIETGVWRGGATIFMQGLLKSYGITDRNVWVADSFEGLPKPDQDIYEADLDSILYKSKQLAVSLETVKKNFEKYGLLDENVRFLSGWFKDTLPEAPIDRIALLRLDGDMYESTMDALVNLYPKLSVGGYILIDDFGSVNACRKAVLDYRNEHKITEEIEQADWAGIFWRKSN